MDYLLLNVFGGSKERLKSALLKEPALLKQPLEKILPRIDILQFLQSVYLDPSDTALFLTQHTTKFAKALVPTMKSWYPKILKSPEEGEHERKDSQNEIIIKEDEIHAAVKDVIPMLFMAYSDKFNREIARVVHWRH